MPKKQKSNNYFGPKEEEYVKIYLADNFESIEEKNRFFEEKLYLPFSLLSENIINTYGNYHGFFKMGYETQELKAICLTYILEKFHKFDPERLTKTGQKPKAYSFFGTIIKRHLIRLSKRAQQKYKNRLDLNDDTSYIDYTNNPNLTHVDIYDNDDKIFIEKASKWFEENHLKIGIKIQKEIDIMHAILSLMKKADNIENTNKKELYIYIREMTDHETKNITPTIKKMKTAYKHLRQNYINRGEIISGSVTL